MMPHKRYAPRCAPVLSALVSVALILAPDHLAAQSAQRVSLQASGEWISPTKDYGVTLPATSTLGREVQARFTAGPFSVGAGYQRSTVFKSDAADVTGTLSMGFLEPRIVVVVVAQRVAPYLAGRVGYGSLLIPERPSTHENVVSYGGGAGVLVAVVPRVAVDLGGQYFVTDFRTQGGSAGYWLARLGLAVGLF